MAVINFALHLNLFLPLAVAIALCAFVASKWKTQQKKKERRKNAVIPNYTYNGQSGERPARHINRVGIQAMMGHANGSRAQRKGNTGQKAVKKKNRMKSLIHARPGKRQWRNWENEKSDGNPHQAAISGVNIAKRNGRRWEVYQWDLVDGKAFVRFTCEMMLEIEIAFVRQILVAVAHERHRQMVENRKYYYRR